ncbi:MAG: hypothetical protein LBK55_02835 [Azoarcus sp.]|jgi:hypothetical protein|nr:hypothetical protein [Azoarcus sp.]
MSIPMILELEKLGVRLSLSSTGELKAKGSPDAVKKYLPLIRDHKADLITELQPDRISAEHETAILAWLASIGENDIVTLGEVIEACRRDADARAYFLGRASERLVDDGKAV